MKEAALACGLTHQSWRNWEAGGSPQKYEEICDKIAEYSGCDPRWLKAGGPIIRWFTDPDAVTCDYTPELPFPPRLALVPT